MAYIIKRDLTENGGKEMDGTAKEIYEAVYTDVMRDVQKNLMDIKPQLVETIIGDVISRLEGMYGEKLRRLEEITANLNMVNSGMAPDSRWIPSYMSPNNQQISYMGGGRKVPTSAYEEEAVNTDRIDVSELEYVGFKYNGWIYYPNEQMGDFLYKVRIDGSENTQLTDYSVCSYDFSVSNGYLHFEDKEFNDRKIKID